MYENLEYYTKKIFALVDCNNFFVSCERSIDPSLNKVPVVVLSNNDGCVISRSNEVKKMGIPMGAPMFKYKKMFDKYKVKILSSNFPMYAYISNKVMKSLKPFAMDIEVYSIDEAFIEFTYKYDTDYKKLGEEIKVAIYKKTKIPVSVGIASTKTLAKIGTELGKKIENFVE